MPTSVSHPGSSGTFTWFRGHNRQPLWQETVRAGGSVEERGTGRGRYSCGVSERRSREPGEEVSGKCSEEVECWRREGVGSWEQEGGPSPDRSDHRQGPDEEQGRKKVRIVLRKWKKKKTSV